MEQQISYKNLLKFICKFGEGGEGTKRILYINRKAPSRGPTSNPFYRSLNSTISEINGTPQFPEYVEKW